MLAWRTWRLLRGSDPRAETWGWTVTGGSAVRAQRGPGAGRAPGSGVCPADNLGGSLQASSRQEGLFS